MAGRKQEIITFKVDEKLAAELKELPNRSQFIRTAILAAIDNLCPLCRGHGSTDSSSEIALGFL